MAKEKDPYIVPIPSITNSCKRVPMPEARSSLIDIGKSFRATYIDTMSSKAFWHNVQPLSLGFRHYLSQTRNLRTQPRDTSSQYNNNHPERLYHPGNEGLATPREVFVIEIIYLNAQLKYSARSIPQSIYHRSRECEESTLCSVCALFHILHMA